MNWLRRFFASPLREAADQARWVVVDCESSGLDPGSDRLLSIGAIAVEAGRIRVDRGFSTVLRQASPSEASNIVIHGISGGEQLGGVDAREALLQFTAFAGEGPLVAFHAAFDRALLSRAAGRTGVRLRNAWLDLAELAPVLYPKQAARCRALDQWLDHFGIVNPARHDALGDAYATAQLFQVLLTGARAQRLIAVGELIAAESGRRWLSG